MTDFPGKFYKINVIFQKYLEIYIDLIFHVFNDNSTSMAIS